MKKVIFLMMALMMCFVTTITAQSDTLKYSDLSGSVKPKGEYTHYLSKDGVVYSVGDELTLGFPSNGNVYTTCFQGDGVFIAMTPLVGSTNANTKITIKRFIISGTKKTGFSVLFRTTGLIGTLPYTIQYENALIIGEIKGFGMTSDEALAEFKKAKDKLDLGLITQEEFDKLKLELSKYIK
jgi:hypothetical protein